jgi:hypothetical protein
MPTRTVLAASGPSRLARRIGVLRRGADDSLVIEDGGHQTPVVIVAPHQLLAEGDVLLSDADGTPVVREGDEVVLTGGLSLEGPAFYAARVAIVEP